MIRIGNDFRRISVRPVDEPALLTKPPNPMSYFQRESASAPGSSDQTSSEPPSPTAAMMEYMRTQMFNQMSDEINELEADGNS